MISIRAAVARLLKNFKHVLPINLGNFKNSWKRSKLERSDKRFHMHEKLNVKMLAHPIVLKILPTKIPKAGTAEKK